MRIRWATILTALVTSVAAGACSANRARPDMWSSPASANVVTVRNDNWLDADVYVVYDGSRFRLGFARGLSTTTLSLPHTLIHQGTVRLMVDPIGSTSTFTSDQIVVSRGQRIELNVNSVLSMSNSAVWNR